MARWESNDHVTYGGKWPWKVKVITPMIGPNISKTAGDAIWQQRYDTIEEFNVDSKAEYTA